MYTVYEIVIDGPQPALYVGVTSCSLRARLMQHQYEARRWCNTRFYRALSQAAEGAVSIRLLATAATKELGELLECHFIRERLLLGTVTVLNGREMGLGKMLPVAREAMRKTYPRARHGWRVYDPVDQITYPSGKAAAEALGTYQRLVSEHLRDPNGRYRTVKGRKLVWLPPGVSIPGSSERQ